MHGPEDGAKEGIWRRRPLAERDIDGEKAAAPKQGLDRLKQCHRLAHGGRRHNDNLVEGFDGSRQTCRIKRHRGGGGSDPQIERDRVAGPEVVRLNAARSLCPASIKERIRPSGSSAGIVADSVAAPAI